jgi:hypothetical protein
MLVENVCAASQGAKEERKLFPKVAGLVTGRGLRRETRLPPGIERKGSNRALHPKPLSYPPLGNSASATPEIRDTYNCILEFNHQKQ